MARLKSVYKLYTYASSWSTVNIEMSLFVLFSCEWIGHLDNNILLSLSFDNSGIPSLESDITKNRVVPSSMI